MLTYLILIIFIDYRVLDLSNNRIKEIEGLEELINLEKLFLSSNRINKISNLNHLSKLKLLELGDNKIKVIDIFNNLIHIKFDLVISHIFSKSYNLNKKSNIVFFLENKNVLFYSNKKTI